VSIADAEKDSTQKAPGPGRMILAAIDNGIMSALKGDRRWTTYCALARHLPDVFPGIERIEGLAGFGGRAIRYATKELEDAGLLVRMHRRGAGGTRLSNIYKLADVTNEATAARIVATLRANPSRTTRTSCNKRHGHAGGANRTHNRMDTLSPAARACHHHRHESVSTSGTGVPGNKAKGNNNNLNSARASVFSKAGETKTKSKSIGWTIEHDDLADTGRLLELREEAITKGIIGPGFSEHDFVAVAEVAMRRADYPAKLFASLVRKGLRDGISGDDDDAARDRLNEYREEERAPLAAAVQAQIDSIVTEPEPEGKDATAYDMRQQLAEELRMAQVEKASAEADERKRYSELWAKGEDWLALMTDEEVIAEINLFPEDQRGVFLQRGPTNKHVRKFVVDAWVKRQQSVGGAP